MSDIGQHIYEFIRTLYPICRSITGAGVRQTLTHIGSHIPLKVCNVPSGTPVFDWTVPREWNITDAYVKNSRGERIIDFQQSNLHVVGYSLPVKTRLSLPDLRKHLFTDPNHPEWIPYRTSYYEEAWGFCLPHRQYLDLEDGVYEVLIDSTLKPGYLTYGEAYLRGRSEKEFLISCHVCHPSLCNDNLSGVSLATFLAKHLGTIDRQYSYRFLFIPGTIGSITWLARNAEAVHRIVHGMVVTGVGKSGAMTYKKSRRGDAEIDRIVAYALKHSKGPYELLDFSPYGYDERQFCSPGFNLPVGCLMRDPQGSYAEYHTSADDLGLVCPGVLEDSFTKCVNIVEIAEQNSRYVNLNPQCEPHLGKRGLYKSIGGQNDEELSQLAMLWILNMSDGDNDLLDIAEASGYPFTTVRACADALERAYLLRRS